MSIIPPKWTFPGFSIGENWLHKSWWVVVRQKGWRIFEEGNVIGQKSKMEQQVLRFLFKRMKNKNFAQRHFWGELCSGGIELSSCVHALPLSEPKSIARHWKGENTVRKPAKTRKLTGCRASELQSPEMGCYTGITNPYKYKSKPKPWFSGHLLIV